MHLSKPILVLTVLAVAALAASTPAFALEVKEIEEAYLKIVRAVRPAVVKINFTKTRHEGMMTVSWESTATGVLVDSDGTVVTIEDGITSDSRVTVSVAGGEPRAAKVLGADKLTGIAVLKLEEGDFTAASIGNSDGVEPGQFIVSVGNAYGTRGTVYYGSVVGAGRTLIGERYVYSDMIQISTPVFPGDPGGLIADSGGRVIGIVSRAYLSRPGMFSAPRSGRDFAKPLGRLRERRGRKRAGRNAVEKDKLEESARPQEKPEKKQEEEREPDSPEQQSEPEKKSGPSGMTIELEQHPPARDVNFAMPINFVMEIAEKIKEHGHVPRPLLGVTVMPVFSSSFWKNMELADEGAQVNFVLKGSPADKAGIKPMDIITRFNSQKISRIHELKMSVLKAELGGKVRMTVLRGDNEMEIEVELFLDKADAPETAWEEEEGKRGKGEEWKRGKEEKRKRGKEE